MRDTVPQSASIDLRNIVESIPALVVCALADGTVEFVNRSWQEYTGYSPQQLSDSGWRSIIYTDDLAKFVDEWAIALSAGKPFETEARVRRSDGQYRWFLIKKALVVSGTRNRGRSLHTLIAFEDINERKQSQLKLQESEARYRVLIETASDAVICADESGTITFVNPSTTRIFGYAATELIGKPLTVLMPESMRLRHELGFRRYVSTGKPLLNWQGAELVGLRKNGQEFAIAASLGEVIRDGHWFITAFIRDISEQKRTEEALRRSEKEFRDVIDTIPAMVWTGLPDGSNGFVNQRWAEYTGLSAAEAGGSGWQSAVHPEDLPRQLEKWRESFAMGKPLDTESRYRRAAEGEYRWMLVRGVPFRDEHGHILRWYGTLTDIEDRKRAEEARDKLRQLETDLAHINRVSTMGEFTASLAHEIKQPIGAAVTNAEACLRLLNRDQPDISEAREAALEMAKDTKCAASIIDRVRLLYQRGSPQLEVVDVNEVIRDMVTLLRNEADRHSITVRTEFAEGAPKTMADRVQLQQALMNLIVNGLEAMRDTSGELSVKSQLIEDDKLLISVTDAGVGLPAQNSDKIFDAFFTTKTQGTGLGLSITRSIVEAHGGRIWATANTGRGATFQFTLPNKAAFVA
jgi:PAS domain S-box-containing protein